MPNGSKYLSSYRALRALCRYFEINEPTLETGWVAEIV
jgi:hypothetical protein